MDKNPFDSGRELPYDDESLKAMLEAGPSAPISSVKKEIPPMPSNVSSSPETKTDGEGPDEVARESMILPSESEKITLRKKFGELRVVPFPYSRSDNKIDCYVLRKLTRSQWRALEDSARKVSESRPNVSADEIFQEKVVASAVVWPALPETEIALTPPGLVPTLFAIIQQMGLFFNPEVIMQLTFSL